MMFTIVAKKRKSKDSWLRLNTWEGIVVEKYARVEIKQFHTSSWWGRIDV